jgi:hypothetical protein
MISFPLLVKFCNLTNAAVLFANRACIAKSNHGYNPFRNYVRELSNFVAAWLRVSTVEGKASVTRVTQDRDPGGRATRRQTRIPVCHFQVTADCDLDHSTHPAHPFDADDPHSVR